MDIAQNWNRIISLRFFSRLDKMTEVEAEIPNTAIPCPETGRKPNIQITGSFTTDDCLPAFNINIKNLYMDLPTVLYPKVEVTAGYKGRLQTFTGSILQMYQEQPGPEGNTIIQCIAGDMGRWMNTTVNLQYTQTGYSLETVLQQIAKALKMPLDASPRVKTLTGKSALEFFGSPREAIGKLKSLFVDDGLLITVRSERLYAYTRNDINGINTKKLNFITTPAQMQAGEEDTAYATVTAPWEPELRPGDMVIFPAKSYLKNFNFVNKKETAIIADTIQFHFGTTGSVNQMTIQGHAVKGAE